MVSPDGVDLEQFQITDTKESARAKLGLPQEAKLVVYTGHLYSWKGADTLADAASTLERGTLVLFVGGTENDVELFKGKYGEKGNVMILGNKPHDSIPLYLRAADVLALPNSGKEKISQLYTSPMKLFEYMASGTPIVASDLPSLREVLNDKNAVLVPPDSPMELARGLKELLADSGNASVLARQALGDVEQYDWKKRAGGILSYIS
jgi:glycosyltransferase involved in cell wall biosynthesis